MTQHTTQAELLTAEAFQAAILDLQHEAEVELEQYEQAQQQRQAAGGTSGSMSGSSQSPPAYHLRMMVDVLRTHHVASDTPLEFICPLTHQVMQVRPAGGLRDRPAPSISCPPPPVGGYKFQAPPPFPPGPTPVPLQAHTQTPTTPRICTWPCFCPAAARSLCGTTRRYRTLYCCTRRGTRTSARPSRTGTARATTSAHAQVRLRLTGADWPPTACHLLMDQVHARRPRPICRCAVPCKRLTWLLWAMHVSVLCKHSNSFNTDLVSLQLAAEC